ncbi:PD-(D/E)XK nuclease family protein [Halanaerobaculum tunisiense]
MKKLYTGPTGSGKTTILREHYEELARKDTTDNILTLVTNATNVRKWRTEVDLEVSGGLQIYSYFSFVQQEVKKYWHLIEKELEQGRQTLAPVLMTVEPAHYIMSKLVENKREQGQFISVNATAAQIALQLIDNLNYAAMNDLSFTEIEDRLMAWANNDQTKKETFQASLEVMNWFRDLCLKERCLDYSLVIDLYNQYLLATSEYYQELAKRYNYLLVDDSEQLVPTAQDLVLQLNQEVDQTYIAYNPEAGFGRFFGSAPKLAADNFRAMADEVVELEESHTAAPEARELADQLASQILAGERLASSDFIIDWIETELRGAMITNICQEVEELIEAGVKPGEIALVAPYTDKVLEFTLENHCQEQDYELLNLTQNRLLLENRFAQALIVMTVLANQDWEIELSFSAIVQTLHLILDFDPVRSSILAEAIQEHDLQLPAIDEVSLRSEIGFKQAEKYEEFKDWIDQWQEQECKLEYFFRAAFGGFLSTLAPSQEDILACRQLIKSVTNFKEVMQEFSQYQEEDLGVKFVEMINDGTLAAEMLFEPEDLEEQLLLATPYTLLSVPYLQEVKYLFLVDISSELWLLGGSKELSNPYILSREVEDPSWGDGISQVLKKEQLSDYLQSLLSKVTAGVYLADSSFNSRGWEQMGQLREWLS